MKIGIITHWDSKDNYGQVLQCYALQRYLISQGYEPFLIRYAPSAPPKDTFYKILHFWEIINISHIKAYIAYRKHKRKIGNYYTTHNPELRQFDEFRREFIYVSDKIYRSFEELYAETWDADAMISGSDQVWNCPEYTRRSFFLDFASDRITKIAYAASFGKATLDERYEKELPRLLRHFKAVGLREKSGVELCRRAGRKDAELVCDPTLLLSGKYYIDNILKTEIEGSNHLFCYFINWPTQIPTKELTEYAVENNLAVRYFNAHGLELHDFVPACNDMTVQSWLASLASAECICTNSFHGTIFSILMHKPFIVLPLQGTVRSMNVRLSTLLRKLGLEERLYDSAKDFSQQMAAPIDWSAADEKLKNFKSASEDFLQKALTPTAIKDFKRNICFQTYGGVNHNFGGLDRVTEILADYFESEGCKVYYLSCRPRPDTDNARQYYLPDGKYLHSKRNRIFFNEFMRRNKIDVLINQEGNVDLHFDVDSDLTHIVQLTVLHFNPDYIADDHFRRKFENMNAPQFIRDILRSLFRNDFIKKNAINYLRHKLAKNYIYQCAKCDCFVLLSDKFRGDMLRLLNKRIPDNICAINNPATFSSDATDIGNKKKEILYVGRLECGQKRLDVLLDIWDDIAKKFDDWEFVIVGSGPDEASLKRTVANRSIPRVRFTGTRNPERYYKDASIFVFASAATEGWGMVLVEAQSFGCVPIAFNSYSSLSEIIAHGKNGFTVTNDNISEYVELLSILMSDTALRRHMAENCISGSGKYDIENIGMQWVRLITMVEEHKTHSTAKAILK